jgi:hypothetical protein
MKAIRAISLSLAIVLLALEVLFSVMVVVAAFHGGDFRTGIHRCSFCAGACRTQALLNLRPKLAVVAAALLGLCTGGPASEITANEWKYLGSNDLVAYHIEFLAFTSFLAALWMRLSSHQQNATGATTEPSNKADAM